MCDSLSSQNNGADMARAAAQTCLQLLPCPCPALSLLYCSCTAAGDVSPEEVRYRDVSDSRSGGRNPLQLQQELNQAVTAKAADLEELLRVRGMRSWRAAAAAGLNELLQQQQQQQQRCLC
jgi:hypothetical protein